ncbi:MAG TPA: glycerate kinase [bacterium]|nr:glycerate kinase [bacterium]
MKILIAPDKFKGVSTAQEIAEMLRNQIQKHLPEATLRLCPVADGGEGTLTSIIYLLKGKTLSTTVNDPLMRFKQAQYGIAQLPEKDTAIIEMAQASGLFRLAPEERNPLETTSYGTGEIVSEAVKKHGIRHLKISLGGSATIDGGLGFLQALGATFKSKTTLPPNGLAGKHLSNILSIDLEPVRQLLKGIQIVGLVDVQVPLLGDHGAARFFGPLKGGTQQAVEELEKGLDSFEAVLSKASGILLKNQKGSGAAGGMGMALLALGAQLESGFDFVAQTLKLEDQMKGCDLVITGEGLMDNSSREGKAPVAVAQMAKRLGIPCIAIVGAVAPNLGWLKDVGLHRVYPLFDSPIVGEEPRKLEVPAKVAEIIQFLFSKKQTIPS